MKKVLLVLLAVLLVLPFGVMMAGNVSAADEVIYVKDGATGDGSSPDNALGSLDAANQIAATKTGDVTIKFVGEVNFASTNFTSNYYYEPTHSNKITWVGNDASSKLVVQTGTAARYYEMGGELNVKDLAIEIDGNKVLCLVTRFYPLTVDTGVTVVNNISTADTISIFGEVTGSYKTNSTYDVDTKTHTANPSITLKSGYFKEVVGYITNAKTSHAGVNLNGKVTITISGANTYMNLLVAVRNSYNTVKDCEIILDGGKFGSFVAAADRKYTGGMTTYGASGVSGDFTMYLTKNFDLAGQDKFGTSGAEFNYKLSGVTAHITNSGALDDTKLGTFVLKADAEIYDAVDADTSKIEKGTFDDVVKVEAAVGTNTTQAPDTTAVPGTTQTPDTTVQTPDTTNQTPDTTVQAPDTTVQAPDTTVQAPDTTNQTPDTTAPAEPVIPSEVIYVKDGATGDGSSEDKAMGSLLDAVNAAAKKTEDVLIKFVGTVTLDGTTFASDYNYEPAHANKIMWAGNDASAKLVIKTGDKARYYVMGGELAIRDLAIEIDGSKVLCLVTHLYDLTVDTGVTVKNPSKASETISVYGALKTTYNKTPFYNDETKSHTVDPTITVKSGSFKQIVGYIGNASTALTAAKLQGGKTVVLNGKVTINISGKDTYIYQLYPVCNTYNTVKDCEITLDGGIIGRFVGATDRKYTAGIVKYGPSGVTGTYTLYLTKNFDLSAQGALVGDDENTKNEFMLALCGSTANKDFAGSLDDKGLGTYVLKADAEIFDAVKAETAKINQATFDKVIKVTAEAGGNANTGDSTIVFATLACISLAAVVVLFKKRATR